MLYFNPRSPYGERLLSLLGMIYPLTFQSTLPLRGATSQLCPFSGRSGFQSTLPLRGATLYKLSLFRGLQHFNPRSPYGERLSTFLPALSFIQISIHAPLTGSDCFSLTVTFGIIHFNPRSPYGERQFISCRMIVGSIFQSTLPLRGATCFV